MKIKLLTSLSLIFLMPTLFANNSSVVKLCTHTNISTTASPVLTQIQNAQCGSTLPALNTAIYANAVVGASNYRFQISNTASNGQEITQTIDRPLRTFNLTQLSTFAFATVYKINVAVVYNGIWQPYGNICIITTPSVATNLLPGQCGITLTSLSTIIYANNISYAKGYRFRIINVLNPSEVFYINRTVREFRMNLIAGINYATTYIVDVAVQNTDDSFMPYGTACNITTPLMTSKIQDSQCGTTLTSSSDIIYANLVSNAAGYRFRITNLSTASPAQTIDRSLREFRMYLLSNIQYNASYKIEVAVKKADGAYMPYGPACTVNLPRLPSPKMQESQCEAAPLSLSEYMYADIYPFATVYRFKLDNSDLAYSQSIDRNLRSYNLSQFSGLQPGATYTVRLAVKVNGVFSNYGKACDVTVPGTAKNGHPAETHREKNNENATLAIAYPNPFSENVQLDFNSSEKGVVDLKIFNILGELVEKISGTSAQLQEMSFGLGLKSGLYFMIITQGNESQTLRLVKK